MSTDPTDNAPNEEPTASTDTTVVETEGTLAPADGQVEPNPDGTESATAALDANVEGPAPTNDGGEAPSVDQPETQASSGDEPDASADDEAPAPEEGATPEDAIDKRACVVSVMIQTGAAKHGAETLATNMNDAEIDTIFACLEVAPRLKIADSGSYQKAMGEVAQRLDEEQKAAVPVADVSEEA